MIKFFLKPNLSKLIFSYRSICRTVMHARRYDAVIFDMGGVLIGGVNAQSHKFETERGLEKDSLFRSLMVNGDKSVWAQWEKGDFCYDVFREKFEKEYLEMTGKNIELPPTMYEWLPHTLQTHMIAKVQSLRRDGYKTALLTNNMLETPGNSFQPIDRSIFDVIIESCLVRVRKPCEEIYRICLDQLGVSADKAVFLDDIVLNLKAAQKLGITTIKVTDTHEAIVELDRVLSNDAPSGTVAVTANHQFNEDGLINYLEKKSIIKKSEGESKLLVRKFSHGQSNPTYYIRVDDQELVLRKKPPGKLLPSAHAIEREYAIMDAIGRYGLPVPKMIDLYEDNDIIGTPFYLMEYVRGSVYKDASLPDMRPEDRANIYKQACEVLCQIHKLGTEDCGIGKKGEVISSRKEYLQRNIDRWWKQYQLSKISDHSSMDLLHKWLLSSIPNDSVTNLPCTLCHGDFRIDNMLFTKEDGINKLRAVVDWELSCFGDPITDLATVSFPYYMPKNFPLFSGVDFQSNLPAGIPTLNEFLSNYCSTMGMEEIGNFKFYQCFVLFRLAAILFGVAKRAQTGQHSGENASSMGKIASLLSDHGMKMANDDVSRSRDSLAAMPLSVDNLRSEVQDMYRRIKKIVNDDIIPAEQEITQFYQNQNNVDKIHPLMEQWKEKAKEQGLWNLFLPIDTDKMVQYGRGLTNLEYCFLCEEMGRSLYAAEVFNCSAPDTGNMEILAKYGTEQQKQDWLLPLLDGKIRSCFGMTEPGVASSDARNIMAEIKDGGNDEYVINGHKWWTSGALHPNCDLCIFMGKTNPMAPDYLQQSMIIVPMKSPGVKIIRPLHCFGFLDPPGGHVEVTFSNVRVPKSNILLGEGKGFQIAQGRLGPGRVHHCMRLIGYAERSMELVMDRIDTRQTFGKKLSEHGMMHLSIAQSRMDIEQARLLVMKTAHMMDHYGNKKSKQEIAMIKVVVPNMAVRVIDRAIQCFGGAGFCEDYPLSMMYSVARILRVADGPDEVHIQSIAQQMIRDHNTIKSAKAQL